MDCIWQSSGGDVSVRDVAETLPEYAYTTVATVLDRLVAKGVLRCQVVKRTKRYVAIGGSGAYTAVLMYDAFAAGTEPDAALRRFAESLTGAEVAVLRRALEELAEDET